MLVSGVRDGLPYTLVPQIMSPHPEQFLRVAHQLLPHSGVVEVNCGCPAPTVVGKGAGSGLLKNPSEFHSYIKFLSQNLDPTRLSVKMRTGYEDDSGFEELITGLSSTNLGRLVIHGRTRSQKYSGQADWTRIQNAASQLPFPVVGSGDITDLESWKQRHQKSPDVLSSMVGRGALRNPWIFEEISHEQSVRLSYSTIRLALQCHYDLHRLSMVSPESLYDLCRQGVFYNPPGCDEKRWSDVHTQLQKSLSESSPVVCAEQASSRSLGRLKLIWNYFRSSLPKSWFQPLVLRSRTETQFFERLDSVFSETASGDDLPILWNPEFDWIYSGGKKAN